MALAARRLCPQPIRPQETPIPDTSRAESRPRFYIRCTDDRAIPPEYQETMSSPLPPESIRTLPTSHSPFFSAPDALAALIDEIARHPSVNRA